MGPRFAAALGVGFACAVAMLPVGAVHADINSDLAAAQSQLAELQRQAAAAAEEANTANLKWQRAQQKVQAKQAELATTQQTLASQQNSLNQIASQIYRNGGVDPTLLILAADSPSDWLSQMGTAALVADAQNTAFSRTRASEQQMTRDEAELEKAERRADKARNQMLDAKTQIDARVAEATNLVSQLQVEQQQQLAEQQAQQQQQQQQQQQDAIDAVKKLPDSTTKPVVEFAIKQVGKKFKAGASGPDEYDASGLVSASWEQAGVKLPHSVQAQYDKTQRVDITQLQPGDIVFLYKVGEHDGIYTGDGYFVHAKGPQDGVVYEKLFTNEYMSQFAGAGRPKA